MRRYVVGVDFQFLNHCLTPGRLRFDELRELIEGQDGDVLEMYAPVIRMLPAERTDEEIARTSTNFLRVRLALEAQGVNVIEAPQKPSGGGGIKQSDDQRLMIKLAVACTRLKPDFLVLLAADGDYAPLVWALRDEGIRTKLITDPGKVATELKVASYNVSDLYEIVATIDRRADAERQRPDP